MTTNERTDLGLTDSAAGCSCCATASVPDTQPAASTITEEVLVEGMTCSHCVMSVTEEISAIDGVDNVSVDLNAGGTSRVTIHSAAPIDAARVRAAVEEAGYALAGTPA
ncbi:MULTISPECIES: heavy-metal-associated domain-containing protein [Microbacterium]|jgi:copper chaperone CopZ|uniref:Copper chaperone CopZ n=1 Tax=Microbacterium invictum TaxID=515415 RepID=A0AA40SMC3_9MICO|nr:MULTISPECIES: cation transporter [Microbacterium]MBB4138883.1 copper chaperone CopZ [Microbacterium invictum]WKT88891.1 cation transporter [Microbacterium liquefaciens]